jgi:hypothetical protein
MISLGGIAAHECREAGPQREAATVLRQKQGARPARYCARIRSGLQHYQENSSQSRSSAENAVGLCADAAAAASPIAMGTGSVANRDRAGCRQDAALGVKGAATIGSYADTAERRPATRCLERWPLVGWQRVRPCVADTRRPDAGDGDARRLCARASSRRSEAAGQATRESRDGASSRRRPYPQQVEESAATQRSTWSRLCVHLRSLWFKGHHCREAEVTLALPDTQD